jgi:hypothetical protein
MSMTPSRRRIEAVRLKHLAEEGWVIQYLCRHCRQQTSFLASDVVDIWDPEMMVYEPPGRCGRCKVRGRMEVRFYFPTTADIGALRLRRPAGLRTVQVWKWDYYSATDRNAAG